jgi:hypothetical protein
MKSLAWHHMVAAALLPALLTLLTPAGPALAAETRVAGWVEPDPATGQPPTRAFELLRAGKKVAYGEAGLQACDEIKLTDRAATVRITLASAQRMRLDARTPSAKLPCTERGLLPDIWAALGTVLAGADARADRAAAMASRGESSAPMALDVPALAAPSARLVAGERSIYLRWVGGVGPFTVTLQERKTGRVVARQAGISAREVWLPKARIDPGNYRLELRQAAGQELLAVAEENLVVEPATALPAPAPALARAELPADVRAIFRADQLVAFEDGRWTLEALQQVAAIKPSSAASAQWLDRHGGVAEVMTAAKPAPR